MTTYSNLDVCKQKERAIEPQNATFRYTAWLDAAEADLRRLHAARAIPGTSRASRLARRLIYADTADGPITDASQYAEQLAKDHPELLREQPAAAPATLDDQRRWDGEAFMRQTDESRRLAGEPPAPRTRRLSVRRLS